MKKQIKNKPSKEFIKELARLNVNSFDDVMVFVDEEKNSLFRKKSLKWFGEMGTTTCFHVPNGMVSCLHCGKFAFKESMDRAKEWFDNYHKDGIKIYRAHPFMSYSFGHYHDNLICKKIRFVNKLDPIDYIGNEFCKNNTLYVDGFCSKVKAAMLQEEKSKQQEAPKQEEKKSKKKKFKLFWFL